MVSELDIQGLSAIFTPRLISYLPFFTLFHFSKTKFTQRFFFATMGTNSSGLTTIITV